jgi:hypothetical protein
MGTASQSITNETQRDQFDQLVKLALGSSKKRKKQLDIKFREVVNQVLRNDPVLAGVRPTMQNAINNKVTTEIANKLQNWIDNGKKPSDWPFRDIEVDD